MSATIALKDGKNIIIANLKSIITHKSDFSDEKITPIEDINSFEIFDNYNYTFVGDNIVALRSSDVLYIEFEK
ncbi:hypothetical protein [Weissella paramesenteroides]|uniref:Uncharacterized protein n=1 Tax=Weissella paramesenteroides TaxID=1249 RepID=A0ABD4XHP7_WEIPA|nr:hypothetical protein [Weissella paramesenteroides]KAA8446521.1 hypothetical protein FKV72_01705 [Weissella paramesenteroides]KAA8454583.1 hypothetical protein FKV71_02075 [Weissella paramesenteroides]MDF8368880.1 hypothetical protein [Weissella paramesenteroides]MDF8370729.1 hypothetical protein [Weissella paramesenteroides]MDF8372544.1 hypothetical protein [Weissella paramesenteroides]